MLTLKISVKVMEYSMHNDAIRWQIFTSISVVIEHLSLAAIVFQIPLLHRVTLKKYVKITMYNIRNVVIRWHIHDFILMAIVIFALSLNIYEIFTKKIIFKNLTLKMNIKVKEEKNRTWPFD